MDSLVGTVLEWLIKAVAFRQYLCQLIGLGEGPC